MVRFARAKGSKGSNEKLPEKATPWHEMKQQMINAKQKKEQIPAAELLAKYKEDNSATETTWAQFEETKPNKHINMKRPAFEENEVKQQPNEKRKQRKINDETDKKNLKKSMVHSWAVMDMKEEASNNNSNINKDFQRPNKGKKIKNSKGNEKQFGKKEEVKLTRKQKEEAGLPFARHKPPNPKYSMKVNVGGRDIELCRFHGYSVKKEDWIRLTELQRKLREKNIPEEELQAVMKLERRRAEKALALEKKKVCYQCRKPGHTLSECPAIGDSKGGNKSELPDTPVTGLCFKCGSTEHTHFQCKVVQRDDYKFAKCFVCNQQGHISRQCPDNPRGLYPRGGGCSECGDVTHFRRDCPNFQKKQQDTVLTVPTRYEGDALEALEVDSSVEPVKKTKRKSEKVVKF